MTTPLSRRQNVSITASKIFFNENSSKLAISDTFKCLRIIPNIVDFGQKFELQTDQDHGHDAHKMHSDNRSDQHGHNDSNKTKVIQLDENIRCFSKSLNDDPHKFLVAGKSKIYEIDWNSGETKKIINVTNFNGANIKTFQSGFVLLGNGSLYKLQFDINQKSKLVKESADPVEMMDDQDQSSNQHQPPHLAYSLTKLPIPFSNNIQMAGPATIKDFQVSNDDCYLSIILSINNKLCFFKRYKIEQSSSLASSKNWLQPLETLNLHSFPNSFDVKDNFTLLTFNNTSPSNVPVNSYCQLIHLNSASVIKTITSNGEELNPNFSTPSNLANSNDLNDRDEGYIHTARFLPHTQGGIILARHGSNMVKIFDNAGGFKKSLDVGFNTSALEVSSKRGTSLAVAGFSNKVEMFHDFIFKSHSLVL